MSDPKKFPTIDDLALHTIEKGNEHMAKQAAQIAELERKAPKVGRFQDEITAIEDEARFALELDDSTAPFHAEGQPHVGEGGATTAYYQNAKLVGFSSRLRDPWNFTILVCIDLR